MTSQNKKGTPDADALRVILKPTIFLVSEYTIGFR